MLRDLCGSRPVPLPTCPGRHGPAQWPKIAAMFRAPAVLGLCSLVHRMIRSCPTPSLLPRPAAVAAAADAAVWLIAWALRTSAASGADRAFAAVLLTGRLLSNCVGVYLVRVRIVLEFLTPVFHDFPPYQYRVHQQSLDHRKTVAIRAKRRWPAMRKRNNSRSLRLQAARQSVATCPPVGVATSTIRVSGVGARSATADCDEP